MNNLNYENDHLTRRLRLMESECFRWWVDPKNGNSKVFLRLDRSVEKASLALLSKIDMYRAVADLIPNCALQYSLRSDNDRLDDPNKRWDMQFECFTPEALKEAYIYVNLFGAEGIFRKLLSEKYPKSSYKSLSPEEASLLINAKVISHDDVEALAESGAEILLAHELGL